MNFKLHPQLTADTHLIMDLPLCRALLMPDADFYWVILVPRINDIREIHELTAAQQHQLIDESSMVSQVLSTRFNADKINIGALGNMVPQLHIHHIARFQGDVAWPGPVWGNTRGEKRDDATIVTLIECLKTDFEQSLNIGI
ncbi:hypothetical protein VST7929_01031 [Vibrio stylophorae]|uniref:HIT domain-containing protein n=1 Tax=Vibrio stylophorae TaxID=659351 RepID=A0ABM8ZSD9_9VIBR|nr:HIT domain-containing protein [Vibrio stylophorae]CAH0533169.1 hypothetical protein VST7929_01031 [Vibrio stylophorae]